MTRPRTAAVRAGIARGRIEFRNTMTNLGELLGWLWLPIVVLVVMFVLRGTPVPGSGFSLGTQSVAGVLAANVVFSGVLGLAVALTMDREDGTLLRAKATPNGVIGYLVGAVLAKAALVVATTLMVLVPAAFVYDGLELARPGAWPTLAWVLVLGLAATLPLGAVLGATIANTRSLGLVTMVFFALAAVSGLFYPITALPGWLQAVGQVFPLYWMGLGLRSALLPDALAAVEIGGSWRTGATVAALGLWALAGALVGPGLLRRAAARESGSAVAARRAQAAQRPAR
ncbi:ABC-2 type transport system permease protein [Pseudonocardia thermophila]|uniref:ABC-2 type transport system permease protein n=1 Tax=Pseudonocardia thermophila TaxID=1848 RepID=A0A1M6WVG4_PSETH|nr:ABC transporter permease [Pseudonocardia thermophila]SHK97713.1 ABC-2 type transport system permease protein [Pseudonocardia thermophila]